MRMDMREAAQRAAIVCWLLCLLACASCRGDELGALSDDFAVSAAGTVRPTLIGADGFEFTQVEAAQQLGLDGQGVRVCVIDDAVDITHPTFGGCTAAGSPAPCRVFAAFNGLTNSNDPAPQTKAEGHGTHVAGIAVGSFPNKLYDADGVPLPYQTGVAPGAQLGAFRVGNDYDWQPIRRALERAGAAQCDIINMSWGAHTAAPWREDNGLVDQLVANGAVAVASAGNGGRSQQGGDVLFSLTSPSTFESVVSVAALYNTANPGALLELDREIPTPSGSRNRLAAVQRADTRASICSPSCRDLQLPQQLVLMRSVPASSGCFPPDTISSVDSVTGKAIVLEVQPDCVTRLQDEVSFGTLWQPLLSLKPAIILVTLPPDYSSNNLADNNEQVPVLWLQQDDGAALAAALASDPTGTLSLVQLPGATVVPLPSNIAGQPADFSSLGPSIDLGMQPSLSAPGLLYSSLPDQTYQTWAGTSMAAPYMSGAVALWLQSRAKAGVPKPADGWKPAVLAAFQNTARPLSYKGTSLAWPPAKIGAGVVQVQAAILNAVSVTPPELLLRTDVRQQTTIVTLDNKADCPAVFQVGHRPAVSLSLLNSWYRSALDPTAPLASVSIEGGGGMIIVPARGSVALRVTIRTPGAETRMHNIVSGFVTFSPAPRAQQADCAADSTWLVPLSVPYQGTTADYSTISINNSLALFAQSLPQLNPAAAAMLQGRPPIFVCDDFSESRQICRYKPGNISIPRDGLVVFASSLLRPVQDVRIQVLNTNGTLLGTTPSLKSCIPSVPLTTGWLNYDQCENGYYDGSHDMSYRPVGGGPLLQLALGQTYRFRVLITPPLAKGDATAGRTRGRTVSIPVGNFVTIGRS